MVLFNGSYDYCGSNEREWYGSDEDLTCCSWCDKAYPEDDMIEREEDGELYCHRDCIKAVEEYEKENYE